MRRSKKKIMQHQKMLERVNLLQKAAKARIEYVYEYLCYARRIPLSVILEKRYKEYQGKSKIGIEVAGEEWYGMISEITATRFNIYEVGPILDELPIPKMIID